MPTLRTLAAVPLLVTLCAPAVRAQRLAPDSVIKAIVQPRIADSTYLAVVVGVLDAGGRRVLAFGDAGNGRPLDGSTVFEIGSISKVFTGTLLAEMAGRGEVRLDDPVSKYLPASVHMPASGARAITLLDLATQSSGLPRMPSNFSPRDQANPYADYTVAQMYAFLSGYTLTREPGQTYEYSNLGVGLLGHTLALRAGTSWESLVVARLLDPLGMRDTRVTLSPALRARLAPGHSETGAPRANWDLPTFAGAGALRSTADDMLTWLAANIAAEDSLTPTAAVPAGLARAMREAHRPRHAAGGQAMSIGLNWHVLERPGTRIVWHNGGTGGYRSYIGFDAARKVGVVVLTSTSQSPDDIGLHLLDPTIPLAPPRPPSRHAAITLDSAVLARYVGEYEIVPTFRVVITRQGQRLFAQATGQPAFEIFAEGETRFFLRDVDAQVTFERDAAGAVTGFVLHQGGADQRARKIR